MVAIAVAGNHKTQVQGPIYRNIKAGLILHTEHKAYYGLLDRLYGHEMVNHSAEEWVHTAMYIPTGSRACGPRYVNEFAFRLNECACQRHTMDRIESMIASTVGKQITYEALTE